MHIFHIVAIIVHIMKKTIDDSWCYNHDRETKRTDGCSRFELQNGLYIKIKSLGIEV